MMMMLVVLLVGLTALPSCQSQEITKGNASAVNKFECLSTGPCYDTYGGFCYGPRENVTCDVIANAQCNPQRLNLCNCCIQCSRQSCSSSTLGKTACRRQCLENEFSEKYCGRFCRCCEPCKAVACKGRCVSHPTLCQGNEYNEGICKGGKCACCVTCKPDPECDKAGGLCVNSNEECPCGFWRSPYYGCNNGNKNCACCVPCPPSNTCFGDRGICVFDKSNCVGHDETISDEACCQGTCVCCEKCKPDKVCSAADGECYKKEIGCPPGLVESTTGNCTGDKCLCCVPDPCPTPCNCSLGSNPGRCVAYNPPLTTTELQFNEYITKDECIGNKCVCYKTCTPDALCTAVNGTCFAAQGGCADGLVRSEMGTCHNKNCLCCVPKPPCDTSPECNQRGDPGRCVDELNLCKIRGGEYINKEIPCLGTAGKVCVCCKTCQPDAACINLLGTCSDANFGCNRGYVQTLRGRCNTDKCLCCIKNVTCVPSEKCYPGRCVTAIDDCKIKGGEYIDEEAPCMGDGCLCCKSCKPELSCENLRGICSDVRDKCAPGYSPTSNGKCSTDQCQCCIPSLCGTTQECNQETDPGRCVTNVALCRTQNGEYINKEAPCKGDGCLCCKSCKPELSCEKMRGICSDVRDKCAPGYSPTSNGKCSTDQCQCCIRSLATAAPAKT